LAKKTTNGLWQKLIERYNLNVNPGNYRKIVFIQFDFRNGNEICHINCSFASKLRWLFLSQENNVQNFYRVFLWAYACSKKKTGFSDGHFSRMMHTTEIETIAKSFLVFFSLFSLFFQTFQSYNFAKKKFGKESD